MSNTIINFFLDRNVSMIDNFADRFIHQKTIYHQKYKDVSLYYDNINKKEVVVKNIKLSMKNEACDFALQEFRVHEKMTQLSDKVPHLYEYGIHYTFDGNVYGALIMEYIGGCGMDSFIRISCITEETFLELSKQLFEVISIMHDANIIHRDIKPENIIIIERSPGLYNLKLIDFGFSRILDDGDIRTISGTLEYISPEIFELKEKLFLEDISMNAFSMTKTEILKATDVWACGITIYELLEQRLPWKENSSFYIQKQLSRKEIFSFICINLELVEIVKSALCKHPKTRLRAKDMYTKISEYII